MSRKKLDDVNTTPGLLPLGPIPDQAPVAAFNEFQHESLINTKGFEVIHYRHAFHPYKESLNGPSEIEKEATHRGFRYYCPRKVALVPQHITIEERLIAQGVFKDGSVIMNVGGRYLDKVPDKSSIVYVRPRDLIVFPSLTEMTEQRFEYNPTGDNQLKHKVKGIDVLFDDNKEYIQGIDFNITNLGEIDWVKGRNPPKGTILSCVYYLTPVYVVVNMMHHLRMLPANPDGHGALPRKAIYAPQQFVAKPSHIMQEASPLNYLDLPPYPSWPDSKNTTGGSF